MKLYFIIFSLLAFNSCTRQTLIDDFSFPAVDSKAAVYCLLSPDDSILVAVKAVQAINSQSKNGTQGILDAHIILKNTTTGQQTTMLYTGKDGLYGCSQRDLPVLPGNIYYLEVSVNHMTPMKATCRMPSKAATIDTIAYGESYPDTYGKRRRVTLTWHDISTSTESYNYFITRQYVSQGNTITHSDFDNSLITQANNRLYYSHDIFDTNTPHTYYLFTTDQHLYTFFTIAQRMRQVLGGNPDDFFGGYHGITPTYTNIENGYGIFGGYMKTSKTVSFL